MVTDFVKYLDKGHCIRYKTVHGTYKFCWSVYKASARDVRISLDFKYGLNWQENMYSNTDWIESRNVFKYGLNLHKEMYMNFKYVLNW